MTGRPVVSRRRVLAGALAAAGAGLRPRDVDARWRSPDGSVGRRSVQAPTGADPLAGLRGASASLLTDALSRVGHDPRKYTMSAAGVRPMFPVAGTIIGAAVTTRYERSRQRTTIDDIRRFVFDPVDTAEPGAVWVTACGTDAVLSMFGDVIALACGQRGFGGMVTDGGCRDLAVMEEIGVPVFARGTCLHGPGDDIRPVAGNVPIVCGGVEVAPGDAIAADVDGVLVIPRDAVPDVVRLRAELEEKEAETRRLIEEGGSLRASYLL